MKGLIVWESNLSFYRIIKGNREKNRGNYGI